MFLLKFGDKRKMFTLVISIQLCTGGLASLIREDK